MKLSTTRQGEQRQRFRVGSTYFFPEGHDIDEVEFDEHPKLYRNVMQLRAKDKSRCLYMWRKMSPDEFVEYTLESKLPMELGKFLIPEVNDYLGFTFDHLKRLAPVAERLDEKHRYEKIIFDAYMENGGFFLTNEQRMMAYEEYKRERL